MNGYDGELWTALYVELAVGATGCFPAICKSETRYNEEYWKVGNLYREDLVRDTWMLFALLLL